MKSKIIVEFGEIYEMGGYDYEVGLHLAIRDEVIANEKLDLTEAFEMNDKNLLKLRKYVRSKGEKVKKDSQISTYILSLRVCDTSLLNCELYAENEPTTTFSDCDIRNVNLTGDWNWEYIAAFNHLGKLRRLPDLSRRGEYVGHRISVPYPHAYIVTRQYITKQCGGAADDE